MILLCSDFDNCSQKRYWSTILAFSGRLRPFRNFKPSVLGCCCRNHLSALSHARRVQCTRDCCPAPMPITCPSYAIQTEFDCVYLSAIVATISVSSISLGIDLFFVTMFRKCSLETCTLFLFCWRPHRKQPDKYTIFFDCSRRYLNRAKQVTGRKHTLCQERPGRGNSF